MATVPDDSNTYPDKTDAIPVTDRDTQATAEDFNNLKNDWGTTLANEVTSVENDVGDLQTEVTDLTDVVNTQVGRINDLEAAPGALVWEWNGLDLSQFDGSNAYEQNVTTAGVSVVARDGSIKGNVIRVDLTTSSFGGFVRLIQSSEIPSSVIPASGFPARFRVEISIRPVEAPDTAPDSGNRRAGAIHTCNGGAGADFRALGIMGPRGGGNVTGSAQATKIDASVGPPISVDALAVPVNSTSLSPVTYSVRSARAASTDPAVNGVVAQAGTIGSADSSASTPGDGWGNNTFGGLWQTANLNRIGFGVVDIVALSGQIYIEDIRVFRDA
jgi:hypothetical protein